MATSITATHGGQVIRTADAVYADAHDAALATAWGTDEGNCNVGQYYESGYGYDVYRGTLEFDLSSLSGLTIVSAYLSLYILSIDYAQTYDVVIVDGTDLSDPIVAADFGDLLDEATSYGDAPASGMTASQYNNMNLNSTGITALQNAIASGVIRFGIRSSRDINSNTPGDVILENLIYQGTIGGSSNHAKLVVTSSIDFIPKIFII